MSQLLLLGEHFLVIGIGLLAEVCCSAKTVNICLWTLEETRLSRKFINLHTFFDGKGRQFNAESQLGPSKRKVEMLDETFAVVLSPSF